ncbi:group III truncated hemoglobin [Mucilaginibacter conchicola]|uniref:Group III truncated hemoglobin n=1 Tax=Mucilaginibacter conchicola TaxID=2303333 RepID=A0A372NQF4_9SPHI|nr:group III truncated hemoglobin [Mucilaginibacter conchicola]RFZ91161.1 group III truncated hemoglobin [Mucilaginibacter conchicola]
MADIENMDSIRLLVDDFYSRVREDVLLSPVFAEFIVDWQPHLLKMYAFWNTILFGVPDYKGNPFAHHAKLTVTTRHFYRWLELFGETVDLHFEGHKAEEAKKRAEIMANMFQNRMSQLKDKNHVLL